MTAIVKTMLAIIAALFAIVNADPIPALPTVDNYYPNTAIVIDFNEAEDLVICEDSAGNIWEFKGIEDWDEGDLVSMLIDGKGTPKIFDDEILLVRYGGWIGHYGAD